MDMSLQYELSIKSLLLHIAHNPTGQKRGDKGDVRAQGTGAGAGGRGRGGTYLSAEEVVMTPVDWLKL